MADVVSIFEGEEYESGIARAVDAVRGGGLVIVPTETVYGVAGLLTNEPARRRLHELRPGAPRTLTVHLSRREDAEPFIDPPGELGRRMIRKVWPGPVALKFDVSPARRAAAAAQYGIDESNIYDAGTITLRLPDHVVAEDVIAGAGGPVVLTSAADGAEPSYRVEQISAAMREKVDLILDAGPARFSRPSTIVHVNGESYDIVRAGVFDERIIEKLLRTTILFVCSGNTCRSPMAEALTRKILADNLQVPADELDRKGLSIVSAGAVAMPGSRASSEAVEAVRNLGADLARHRSRTLSVELINQADMIFTMGRSHARAVTSLVPGSADKVETLNPTGDIEDPIGSDVAVYQALARRMQDLIHDRLAEHGVLKSE